MDIEFVLEVLHCKRSDRIILLVSRSTDAIIRTFVFNQAKKVGGLTRSVRRYGANKPVNL